jgi:hypothetical protein
MGTDINGACYWSDTVYPLGEGTGNSLIVTIFCNPSTGNYDWWIEAAYTSVGGANVFNGDTGVVSNAGIPPLGPFTLSESIVPFDSTVITLS